MALNPYEDFIASKQKAAPACGLETDAPLRQLFPFQRDITRWALAKGRAAIFADCGLGKTPIQLHWAREIIANGGGPALILAPLAVAEQTVGEGDKFGIPVRHCRDGVDVGDGINITNYERLHRFDPSVFGAVVLDESSILKAFNGKTRNMLVDAFAGTPYRLCCTATPAPNDFTELGNHAEFLSVLSHPEMLALFFINDSGRTSAWRLKRHGRKDFWAWVCSWAVMLRHPSDLGYDDDGFRLPPLRYEERLLRDEGDTAGTLFPLPAKTLRERQDVRKRTVLERAAACAELIRKRGGRWVVWCNLNAESRAVTEAIEGSVEITGSHPASTKEDRLVAFTRGDIDVLVTKPTIAGFGLNWQHCHQMAFVGLSDSYEQFYQAVRRCWRFGQLAPVDAHIILMETEEAVVKNVRRKEQEHQELADGMIAETHELTRELLQGATVGPHTGEEADMATGDNWMMILGDCVETVRAMDDGSIDFSVFSPPFASLYTYSDSPRDMGNCDDADFATHFGFLVPELLRVIKPGRLCSVHCMNLPLWKWKHGTIGLRDFRGEIVRLFSEHGWIFHSEVCIWKDPVTAMQRTKALGLLYKQLRKDSSMSRMGIADYLVTFRAPGINGQPIAHTPETFPLEVWQRYAEPIWTDIDQTDTLNFREARGRDDERHICPLQLEVIRRACRLWSNPGDLVLSPFAGIGSEGYVAIQMGRRFVGVELKRSYYEVARRNLDEASRIGQQDLWAAK